MEVISDCVIDEAFDWLRLPTCLIFKHNIIVPPTNKHHQQGYISNKNTQNNLKNMQQIPNDMLINTSTSTNDREY